MWEICLSTFLDARHHSIVRPTLLQGHYIKRTLSLIDHTRVAVFKNLTSHLTPLEVLRFGMHFVVRVVWFILSQPCLLVGFNLFLAGGVVNPFLCTELFLPLLLLKL